MLSQQSDSQIVLEGVSERRRLFTGNKSFDKHFGIMSGTATIMYVQNQTFSDPMNPLITWLTHEVQKNETLLLVTTYADPIAIARWCARRIPPAYETFIKTSLQDKYWWVDLFTYSGFGEHERGLVTVSYREQLKERGGNPNLLITPRKPDDLQSVDGFSAALQNVLSPVHGRGTIRMFMAYVDDFIEGVGPQAARNYMRRLINIMRKFGHTLVLLMGWRGTLPEIHTAWERMADQVLRWGYGDVPGQRQPSKFLQILKTTAPDEITTYLKVPYFMKEGAPVVGKAEPQEKPPAFRRPKSSPLTRS